MSGTGNVIRWDVAGVKAAGGSLDLAIIDAGGSLYGVTMDEMFTVEVIMPQLGQNYWQINIATREAQCVYAGRMDARWTAELDAVKREAVWTLNRELLARR